MILNFSILCPITLCTRYVRDGHKRTLTEEYAITFTFISSIGKQYVPSLFTNAHTFYFHLTVLNTFVYSRTRTNGVERTAVIYRIQISFDWKEVNTFPRRNSNVLALLLSNAQYCVLAGKCGIYVCTQTYS